MDPANATRAFVAIAMTLGWAGAGACAAPPEQAPSRSAPAPPLPHTLHAPHTTARPFGRFDLPDEWEARHWANPDVQALLALTPQELAALVPTQAGIHFCRCPACDAPESDDPLTWSARTPDRLTCKRCGVIVPDDRFPAPDDKKKVPEESVEVLPGIIHKYPYHDVEAEKQRYPGERLYLNARRDDAAREFLARAALYAAVKQSEQAPGQADPRLARLVATLLIRFAQVYPAYATHCDQPLSAKYFDRADLAPPYRSGYSTGKWCWTGSQDIPLNLVIAYDLVRDDPAFREVGRILGEPNPAGKVERDLFRRSALFVRMQPEEANELALQADRGLLAVGILLNDPAIVNDASARLGRLAERGFSHDGVWGQGSLYAHRRVVTQLDGWLDRLLASDDRARIDGVANLPAFTLARRAEAASLPDRQATEIAQASWPSAPPTLATRSPAFLGGAGIARLSIGDADNALDLELRSLEIPAANRIDRQSLRLSVGGRLVLGDLSASPPTRSGYEFASVSRNTVVIDGLNQRESLANAAHHVPSGNFLFFAADPDFQVASLEDPHAYWQSATRYRQTVVACAGPKARYMLSVFEVHGGLQHDQLFHTSPGSMASWGLSVPGQPAVGTLLAPGLSFVATDRPGENRWFVQSYGELKLASRGRQNGPSTATLTAPAGPAGSGLPAAGLRLHFLGDTPSDALVASEPDPDRSLSTAEVEGPERRVLILRRRSADGATLRTTFVTLFEPTTGDDAPAIVNIRRVEARDAVLISLETPDGPETILVSLKPGSPVSAKLLDGRVLSTDGLAVRLGPQGLALAGGTYADIPGQSARQRSLTGKLVHLVPRQSPETPGYFETNGAIPDPESLVGRALIVRHGDGTTRGWTLKRVISERRGSRLYVNEELGFNLDPRTGVARYLKDPGESFAGPHTFTVERIARGLANRP